MEKSMNLPGAVKEFWNKTFDYKSCTSRREYWLAVLFQLIVSAVGFLVYFIGVILFNCEVVNSNKAFSFVAIIISAYLLVSIIPWISLTVRRLHDTGKSGWWTLILAIVGIGLAILLFLCASRRSSDRFMPEENAAITVYGPPEFFYDADDPDFEIVTPEDIEIPVEVYGPPEYFENEDEKSDDQ